MSATISYTEKNKNLAPKLRFKGFEGNWNKYKLMDISLKIQDGTHFSPSSFDEGEFLYLTSKNIKNGYIELANAQFISKVDHENIYKRCDVKKGDIILTKDGTIGHVCVNELDEPFSLLSSVAFLRPKKEWNNYFIYQILVSPLGQKEITNSIAGQALKRITLTKINNFKYLFPTLPEQQKIASFLSAIDEKIQLLTRKKDLLEQYKKGVMQQLFSGKLRFKDVNGEAFPNWEEKRLGDVGKIRMCKRIFNHQTSETGDIPFYKIGTFGKVADAYIPKDLFLEFKGKYPYPKEGEILMSASGTIGRTVVYDGSEAYFQDSNIVWIENNEELITNAFLFYVYQVVRYNSEGGTIQRLYNSIISKAIFLSPSLSEQQKVTKLLSSIDNKIEIVTKQKTQTQTFKKGLLQQMFV